MINPALFRLTERYATRRLLQSLLFIMGVALGVAVGVAIDLANSSARRAFDLSVNTVTGRTTHQIVGGPAGLPTEVYEKLRVELGINSSAPIIDTFVRASMLDGHTLRLLGVDPFAEAPFRGLLSADQMSSSPANAASLYAFMTQPNTVLISQTLADRFDLRPGDTIRLQTNTRGQVDVRIVGLLQPSDSISKEALADLMLADIATAQEIAGRPGYITRVDLILPDNADLSRIRAILPPGAVLTTPSESRAALSQMTDAFELNLQALSLLALLVGVFLIYNTVTFSVVQRRPVIGILRSLGTTRRQIFTFVLAEALLLGTIGTLLGLGLGVVLGQGAVRLVSQSINDLYFRVSVQGVTISATTLIKGAIIGLSASLIAAVIPSLEATRTPPVGVMRRSEIEQSARRRVPIITMGALILCGAGIALLRLPTQNLIISFAALFLILVGCALLTPLALVTLMGGIVPITGRVFGVLGRMAPRAVVRSLSRTSVAVAALTVAVSVIVGVSLMIRSFRTTVADWLNTTLAADIYISPAGGASQLNADIDPGIVDRLQAIEGVTQVATVRTVTAIAPDYPDLPPANLVVPSDLLSSRRFAWNHAPNGETWAALQAGDIIVSEPFAYRRAITPQHNTIRLLTDQGERIFTVVGVYYDYTTDQGAIMMADSVYRQLYDDPYISAIALELEPGTSLQHVLDTLRTDFLPETGLQAQSNRSLRQSALKVFDRTFSITIALRGLATIVAFIGILSALMSLQLEHTRQYGIMRANGLTPRQLRLFTFIQTGLMGSTAGLLALPIGWVLALVLIEVINVRSFGWTMDLALRPQEFIQAFAVALIASLAAGVYPAWRLGKLATVQAIRSE